MKYDWLKWFKEFLEEWEKQAGYKLETDADFELRLMTEYMDEGISPQSAVDREMSSGL